MRLFNSDGRAATLKHVLIVSIVAGLLGSAFAMLVVQFSFTYFLRGFSDGFFIGGLMGAYSLYFSKKFVQPRMRRVSFLGKVCIHSGVYSVLYIVGVYLAKLSMGFKVSSVTWDLTFYSALAYALILALLINFVFEVSSLLGKQVTWGFIRGTYSEPIEEKRFFLFVDLVSSTSIAEKIGNKKYLKLLSHFFYDLGQAVLDNNGEIYKYVGDEAIISWKNDTPHSVVQAIQCFRDFEKIISIESSAYQKEFQFVPQFRAGLHGGTVIAGELGEAKKEIAYLGDVVNTTARLLDVAKEFKIPLVGSQYVIDHVKALEELTASYTHLKEMVLKGKTQKMDVYSISS